MVIENLVLLIRWSLSHNGLFKRFYRRFIEVSGFGNLSWAD